MTSVVMGHPLVRAGTVIDGRYKIVRTLGEGGAGLVFEAEQLSVGRSVALKILRLDRWSEVATKRFAREAIALGKVQSARVLQVLEQGNDTDVGPYLVTELSTGPMLAERLARVGAMDTQTFLPLARAILDALADVHAAGLLHRDLKPSNIALPNQGPIAAKLLDFGLATGAHPQEFSRLTKTDDVVGSLPYVAPELFDGESATVQSDLWALGVLFYEMLGGRRPFAGESSASLMKSILSHDVKWEILPADLPAQTRQLLKRLLSREPEARPANCAQARSALDVVPASPPPTDATSKVRTATIALAGVLAGVLLSSAVLLYILPVQPTAPEMVGVDERRTAESVATASSSGETASPSSQEQQRHEAVRIERLEQGEAVETVEGRENQNKSRARRRRATPSTETHVEGGQVRAGLLQGATEQRVEEQRDEKAISTWQGGVIEDYP